MSRSLILHTRGVETPLLAALLVAALLVGVPWVPAVRADAVRASGQLAVATENDVSTRTALAILRSGGNAVDAAVAAALVAGVTSPSSSGLGGGGFALVWEAKTRAAFCLDFRETAPRAIDVAAFERRPLPAAERGQLVGVPGEAAGLFDLHRRFGRLRWGEVVRPAARAALEGFPVSRHLARTLAEVGPALSVDVALWDLFRPGGQLAPAGARLRNPALARTLTLLASDGPRGFYEGRVAADLAATAHSAGGALSTDDLAAYRPVVREALHVSWEGREVFTMPPPSAGGLMLAEAISMLPSSELRSLGFGTGAYVHLLAEVLRGAVADRMQFVGDPDVQPVDVAALLSPERLAARRSRIAPDRTHRIPSFVAEEHGTHHLVTADRDGNVVSLTTTVNHAFGTRLLARASGIVLNDEMDDFNSRLGALRLGVEHSPNRARPGARPTSTMMPTLLVRDGVALGALGGSGGMMIGPNVAQVFLAHLAFGHSPQRALTARRFDVPTSGPTIKLEPGAPAALRIDLERRGETVEYLKSTTSAVQLLTTSRGRRVAAADPRKYGTAVVD